MFVPIVLAAVCLASCTALAAYDKPFYKVEDDENMIKDFVKEHKKIYNPRERLGIFKETLKNINGRNSMFSDSVFVDLMLPELQQYRGFKLPIKTLSKLEIPESSDSAPVQFDWRDHKAVTHVKNQGQNGSSYIFSIVGNAEGQYAIKHHQNLAFSEQQVIDCIGEGSINEIMGKMVQKGTKLEKEDDYPYNPPKKSCNYDARKGVALMKTAIEFVSLDEESLKELLFKYGPLVIGLNANDLPDYKGGILEPNKCKGQLPMDYAMLLVGYGEEKGKKFWTLKNSWGTSWGEHGYLRILRGVYACGIPEYVFGFKVK